MTCTNCGAALDSAATACPVCGTPVAGGSRSGAGGTTGDDPARPTPPWRQTGNDTPPSAAGFPPPPNRASGLPGDARTWALAAHLSAFLGAWVALAFLGPLIVWLLKRDEDPFINHHSREALNFNISVAIYGVVLAILAIPIGVLTLGLGFIPLILIGGALGIFWIVLTIIAAVSASNGELYRYPLTIRLVS